MMLRAERRAQGMKKGWQGRWLSDWVGYPVWTGSRVLESRDKDHMCNRMEHSAAAVAVVVVVAAAVAVVRRVVTAACWEVDAANVGKTAVVGVGWTGGRLRAVVEVAVKRAAAMMRGEGRNKRVKQKNGDEGGEPRVEAASRRRIRQRRPCGHWCKREREENKVKPSWLQSLRIAEALHIQSTRGIWRIWVGRRGGEEYVAKLSLHGGSDGGENGDNWMDKLGNNDMMAEALREYGNRDAMELIDNGQLLSWLIKWIDGRRSVKFDWWTV
jgi:hypothetical protein